MSQYDENGQALQDFYFCLGLAVIIFPSIELYIRQIRKILVNDKILRFSFRQNVA